MRRFSKIWHWVFSHFVLASTRDIKRVDLEQFRNFRESVLEGVRPSETRADHSWNEIAACQTSNSFALGRKRILEFRQNVYTDFGWDTRQPIENEGFVARSLAIYVPVPLRYSILLSLRLELFALLAPAAFRIELAAQLASSIRSVEGRRIAFKLVLHRLVREPGGHRWNNEWLSDELDFILRRFDSFESPSELYAMEVQPLPLLKAAFLMGVRSAPELTHVLERLAEASNPRAVAVLVEEGVLKRGHPPLSSFVTDEYRPNNLESKEEIGEFRKTVHVLKKAGVDADALLEKSRSINDRSLEYLGLLSGISLSTIELLDKALRLCLISPDLLRFLVEEGGRKDLPSLIDWYYSIGQNAAAYSGSPEYSGATRELFLDCMRRRTFLNLNGNASALVRACWDFTTAKVGDWDHSWSEEERAVYHARHEAHRDEAYSKCVPVIRDILDATGGPLFSSVLLDALNGEDYKAKLSKLSSLMEQMTVGGGPRRAQLSQLEQEALCMAYGVSQDDLNKYWESVCGREVHLSTLELRDSYEMKLVQDNFELSKISASVADTVSSELESLSFSASYAKEFGRNNGGEPLHSLRRKHLTNQAATPKDLWRWFGFLLGICKDNEQVRPWIDRSFEEMQGILQSKGAAAAIENFRDFVSVSLADALSGAIDEYTRSLSQSEIELLRDNLRVLLTSEISDSLASLQQLITRLLSRISDVYCRWADGLRRQLIQRSSANEIRAVAVLSKRPAAFFARFAFGLCTSHNTAMWDEERYCHLLIFDPLRHRLLGMAIVYVQQISGYFLGRKVLVVRALNTRVVDGVRVNAESFIDAVFQAATKVAKENDMAAVLFPKSSTYFSNQSEIERGAQNSQATKRARTISSRRAGPIFYSEETNAGRGGVGELYISWVSQDHAEEAVLARVTPVNQRYENSLIGG